MSDTLDAIDAVIRARSLCHLFGMAVSTDDPRDREAISALADTIERELDEAVRLLSKQNGVRRDEAV